MEPIIIVGILPFKDVSGAVSLEELKRLFVDTLHVRFNIVGGLI